MARERSTKPAAVKRRLRNAGKTLITEVDNLYHKPIEEWDFDELQAGRPRDPETGKLERRGTRPKWISPAIMVEAQRRLRTMTAVELSKYTGSAISVMIDLMQSSHVDLVRFNAAKYVLDQIIGMPMQRVEVEGTVNVSTFLADVIVNPDGEEVIDGEYTVDDEEEDE